MRQYGNLGIVLNEVMLLMSDIITVNDVYYKYPSDDSNNIVEALNKNVLSGVSLNVGEGEFLAILGQNGSGKSTLARMLNGLIIPDRGSVTVCGVDTADDEHNFDIKSRVGLVLQNPDNQLITSIVEEDVAFAPENLGIAPIEIRKRVDDALMAVDMYEFRRSAVHKLSGGQKQRVAIAGVLAMLPCCIVLDEPTAMLDPKGRREVLRALMRLNREQGISIVMITHYMQEATQADRIVVMDKGKILTQGTPKEVFSQAELLISHNLSVPQSAELIYNLQKAGISMPDGVISDDECVEALLAFI